MKYGLKESSMVILFLFILIFLPLLLLIVITPYSLILVPIWASGMMPPLWLFINYRYLKIAPEEFRIKDNYVGVVITSTNLELHQYRFIYGSGILLLIEYLKRKNQPFKLLKNFDKAKFKEMIDDKKCNGMYILGHGLRHGLRISKDEVCFYCEFKDAPKKDFIIQLHCNHLKGKSLADFLHAKEDFPTDKKRYDIENRKYFLEKLKQDFNIDTFNIFSDFIKFQIKNILRS